MNDACSRRVCVRVRARALTNTSIYTIILLKSVAVSKLQVAILARSSRETSQTVRNLSICEKHTKRGGTGRHGLAAPTHGTAKTLTPPRCVCAGVCVRACASVRA